MADAKTARLIAAETVRPHVRWMTFDVEAGPLGFLGGQYVIVDSGIVLPSGKVAKRAYSIVSSDEEQNRFELVARRIGGGPGSNYLNDLPLGSTLKFSGPWGKFLPVESVESGPTLIVATDTGITAALGLVQSVAFRERLANSTLLWLVESNDYFLPEAFFQAKVPRACGQMLMENLPPVGHRERVPAALSRFDLLCARRPPARVYLAGDGAVLYPLAEVLSGAGIADSNVALECFFNNPAKKVGVSGTGDARA